jgi:hypothetical protein
MEDSSLMLSSYKRFGSLLGLTAFAVALASCGGGAGGGSSIPNTNSSGGGNASTSGDTASSSMATQRSVTASSLSAVGSSVDFNQMGTPAGISSYTIASARGAAYKRVDAASSPACNNGVEFSQSSTGAGQVTQTIEFFYDSGCTQPFKLVVQTLSFTASGGTISGTEEVWNQSGAIAGYKTQSATFVVTGGQVSEVSTQRSFAPAPSAPPIAQQGQTCLFGTGNPVDCGGGNTTTVAQPSASSSSAPGKGATPAPSTGSIGFEGTITGAFVTPSPSASPSSSPTSAPKDQHGGQPWWNNGPSQLQLTVNGTGYTGAAGSLTLAAGTAPAWTIGGGTQASTLSGTIALGFGGWGGGFGRQCGSGAMSSINLTLDDITDGLTIQLTSAGFGKLKGSVTNSSGATVATISLDASGSGTITYTSGAVDQVSDWVVIS